MIIEETLKQRYKGVKNEAGVWVTPAFPKLIYVLEEDNIDEGSPYFYLTELAAKCTSKRLVPDYISEKKMKELKKETASRLWDAEALLARGKTKTEIISFTDALIRSCDDQPCGRSIVLRRR